jgi:plastocyanin
MVRTPAATALALAAALAGACGGGGNGPSSPGPPAENPYRITIGTNGRVSPADLTVPPGTRVLFVNNDSRPHEMTSDAHPDHLDCPPINAVGLLSAGQSRETGNLVTLRTCGFHDHINPDSTGLQGRILIR